MTDRPQSGRNDARYRPGRSGNPKGRPKGVPDRRNQWRVALAECLPDLIHQLERRAQNGDDFAIKLILERVAPPLRPDGIVVTLPELAVADSLTAKANAVFNAIGEGRIPVDAGRALIESLTNVARIAESDELAKRVEALELGVTK